MKDQVEKIDDFEPQYPTVRMHPGAKMPTAREVQYLEAEMSYAQARGLPQPPMPAGFSIEDPSKLKEKHISRVQHWGIAEPTLDALRNRSLPTPMIRGYYHRHFYSNLYANNFYRGQDFSQFEDHEHHPDMGVVGQRHYPLDGPPVELKDDGMWHPIPEAYNQLQYGQGLMRTP